MLPKKTDNPFLKELKPKHLSGRTTRNIATDFQARKYGKSLKRLIQLLLFGLRSLERALDYSVTYSCTFGAEKIVLLSINHVSKKWSNIWANIDQCKGQLLINIGSKYWSLMEANIDVWCVRFQLAAWEHHKRLWLNAKWIEINFAHQGKTLDFIEMNLYDGSTWWGS